MSWDRGRSSGRGDQGLFFMSLGRLLRGAHQYLAGGHIDHHFVKDLIVTEDIEVINPNAPPLFLLKILGEFAVARFEGDRSSLTIRDGVHRRVRSQ